LKTCIRFDMNVRPQFRQLSGQQAHLFLETGKQPSASSPVSEIERFAVQSYRVPTKLVLTPFIPKALTKASHRVGQRLLPSL
jgi:hypothetical protein